MSKNYYVGDIEIEALIIGNLDAKRLVQSFQIYETIFTPGITADIRIIDTEDYLGRNRFSGGERVYFVISVLGSKTNSYEFLLYEVSEVETVGPQTGKSYVFKCVSEESFYARTNFVSKSYEMLCSEMVQDIFNEYLKSQKNLILEQTSTPQKIVIPNQNPFSAINLIRRRAISAEKRGSFYLFFENMENEEQTFHFETIEKLFESNPVKDFNMSATENVSIRARRDDQIIAFKIPYQSNALDVISYGGKRRITTFNFTTWDFTDEIVETNDTNFGQVGGSGTFYTQRMRPYLQSDSPPQSIIPVDISQRPETGIPERTPDIQAILALVQQNALKIKVIGDTCLTSGVTINCEFSNRTTALSGSEERLMNGKFLISRIKHDFNANRHVKYYCTIECIKGRYEE